MPGTTPALSITVVATMQHLPTSCPLHRHRRQAGFTLIELMAVVAILGILASLASVSYTKNLRASYRTQVIADLANLNLRQKALFAVRGHYATTVAEGDDTESYPVKSTDLAAKGGAPIPWAINSAAYKLSAATDVAYTRGGKDEHGFNVLNFVPQNGSSRCAYGSVAGDGTRGRFGDTPKRSGLAMKVFPADTDRFFARDWFYSYAYCDFDGDGNIWTFTANHVTPTITPSNENWGG